MEKGKCDVCGTDIYGIGYCYSCADQLYKKMDEEYPFKVIFGDDYESFKTQKEADEFCDILHHAYVIKK